MIGNHDRAKDWEANPTILSGDIGTSNNDIDNRYHVVYIDASSGMISSQCTLDGFHIHDGNANGSTELHAGGAGLYTKHGEITAAHKIALKRRVALPVKGI